MEDQEDSGINPNPVATVPIDQPSMQPQAAPLPAATPAVAPQLAPRQPRPLPDIAQQLLTEDQNLAKDLANGLIKPKTYKDFWNGKSTSGKIGTIFGLMLSGAGTGLTGGEDPLLGMINKEIENDLQAQKQNMGNKKDLWKLIQASDLAKAQIENLHKTGQLSDEHAKYYKGLNNEKLNIRAKMIADRTAMQELATYVEKLPAGPEKQAGAMALSKMAQEADIMHVNMADKFKAKSLFLQSLMDKGQQGQAMDPEKSFKQNNKMMRLSGDSEFIKEAERAESHHFPGLKGESSRPMTPEDSKQMTAATDFQDSLLGLINFRNAHKGQYDRLTPEVQAKASTMAKKLQDKYARAMNMGVITEGKQGGLAKLIPDNPVEILGFLEDLWANDAILETTKNETQHTLDNFIHGLGFEGREAFKPTWVAPKSEAKAKETEKPKIEEKPKYKEGEKGVHPKHGPWTIKNGKKIKD